MALDLWSGKFSQLSHYFTFSHVEDEYPEYDGDVYQEIQCGDPEYDEDIYQDYVDHEYDDDIYNSYDVGPEYDDDIYQD